ncbi:MAG: HIRAN domain-containing protein [Coriobacteriales bacterium]|nr:HIRAN domain-containing protein [Coriobacteriales bacterium]
MDNELIKTAGQEISPSVAASLNLGVEAKPFSNEIVLVEHTRVVGTKHIENIEDLILNLAPGDKLKLIRDTKNLYNKYSIKITNQDSVKLGFVSCNKNEMLASMLDGGKEIFARILSISKIDDWNKIDIEVILND